MLAGYYDGFQEFKMSQLIYEALEERFSVNWIDMGNQFYFFRYKNNLTIGQCITKINNYAQQLVTTPQTKDIKRVDSKLTNTRRVVRPSGAMVWVVRRAWRLSFWYVHWIGPRFYVLHPPLQVNNGSSKMICIMLLVPLVSTTMKWQLGSAWSIVASGFHGLNSNRIEFVQEWYHTNQDKGC